MIEAAPKVRSVEPGCLRSLVRSSYEWTLLGRSNGQPGEAWSSCECSRRPNLLASTTTLMLSLMGAAAASHGIEGAFARDLEQQVVQQDLCK